MNHPSLGRRTLLGSIGAAGIATTGLIKLGQADATVPGAAPNPARGSATLQGIGTFKTLALASNMGLAQELVVRHPTNWKPRTETVHAKALEHQLDGIPLLNNPKMTGRDWAVHVVHATTISGDWLQNYVESGRVEWLNKAKGVIRGLCKRATRRPTPHGTALFPKYEFPYTFTLGNSTKTLTDPWYTSFGSSRVLNQAVRIHHLTGEAEFKRLADQLLAAYSVGFDKDNPSLPWFMGVDADGYLWPEEYPLPHGGLTKVINGTPSGWYGVEAYGELIGETDLTRKISGGVYATMEHCATVVRHPSLISYYYAEGSYASRHYHHVNVATFHSMWKASGYLPFARVVDGMMRDWNCNQGKTWNAFSREQPHKLLLKKGTSLWIRRTRADLSPLPATRWWVPSDQVVTTGRRWKYLPGQPVWSEMVDGPLAGQWVAELPGSAMQLPSVRGMQLSGEAMERERPDFLDFAHRPVPLVFKANVPITAYRYDARGRVLASKRGMWPRQSLAQADAMAHINGTLHVRVKTGSFAGMWTPTSPRSVCFHGL